MRTATGEKDPTPGLGCGPWQVAKLEIRTSLTPEQWPIARVELEHETRGRLCELAWKAPPMECLFQAMRQAVAVEAKLVILHVGFSVGGEGGEQADKPSVVVRVEVMAGGYSFEGHGTSDDLLISCAYAYLEALSRAAGEAVTSQPPEQI